VLFLFPGIPNHSSMASVVILQSGHLLCSPYCRIWNRFKFSTECVKYLLHNGNVQTSWLSCVWAVQLWKVVFKLLLKGAAWVVRLMTMSSIRLYSCSWDCKKCEELSFSEFKNTNVHFFIQNQNKSLFYWSYMRFFSYEGFEAFYKFNTISLARRIIGNTTLMQ
jgi:hypothetical protein